MRRFRSKPSEIEAVQYGPEFRPGLVREVAEFIAGRSLPEQADLIEFVEPVPPWDPPDPTRSTICIRAGKDGESGWVSVPLGTWVARNAGDLSDHWPIEPEHFAKKYEEVYITKTGRQFTDEDMEELADEAERGYDVDKLRQAKPRSRTE